MTFSFDQSLKSGPEDLRDVARLGRLAWWQRVLRLQLCFAAPSLLCNSSMSMACGWFFFPMSEAFVLGDHDFRLPGLGSYMSLAIERGDAGAQGLEPETLGMDEPFSALDVLTDGTVRYEVIDLFPSRASSVNTILMVTPSIPDAVFMAMRLAVLAPQPRAVRGVFDNPLPGPREEQHPDLLRLGQQLHALITQSITAAEPAAPPGGAARPRPSRRCPTSASAPSSACCKSWRTRAQWNWRTCRRSRTSRSPNRSCWLEPPNCLAGCGSPPSAWT